MKRYANAALAYALLAMAGGVFYREFTKFNGFTGKTTLSVVHTLEKSLHFSGEKTGRTIALYHVGLNVTGAALMVRGVAQALSLPLSRGLDASISGIGGIGHLLLGVSIVLLLLRIRKAA